MDDLHFASVQVLVDHSGLHPKTGQVLPGYDSLYQSKMLMHLRVQHACTRPTHSPDDLP